MIPVRRPVAVPAVLLIQGVEARHQHEAAYAAAPANYGSGNRLFTFDRDIYGHADVKAALRLAQHDKCCFCESKVTHIAFGDVEHFRPKAAFRQRPSGPLLRPGYYWLAYEWTNLFFCCQLCNQRFKQNLFPLRHSRRRARSHRDDIAAEEPLFLNPEEDNSRHVRFRDEYVESVRNSRRGAVTIDALGLNRKELILERRNHLGLVMALLNGRERLQLAIKRAEVKGESVSSEDSACVAQLNARLTEAVRDDAEYAAMARAALAKS
jgi:uncharacterized protein (TIGR02646 family)